MPYTKSRYGTKTQYKKMKSCVKAVGAAGKYNPYAVCRASIYPQAKTYRVTLGRMFHKGVSQRLVVKAMTKLDAIHILAHKAHDGLIPKDASLKSIREVR